MSEDKFQTLLQKVHPRMQKKDTILRDALSAQIKLQITLRYLATGDSLGTLSVLYRVPKNTISQFIPNVCEAIYDSLQNHIQVSLKKNIYIDTYALILNIIKYNSKRNWNITKKKNNKNYGHCANDIASESISPSLSWELLSRVSRKDVLSL